MQANTQHRLGLWAIAILVVLNLCLLGLFWYEHFSRPQQPRVNRADPEALFIAELNLDQQQIDTVRSLRKAHLERTDPIRSHIVELGTQMTEELFTPEPDTTRVRQLSEQIGKEQAEFERQVYSYFNQINQLLRADQHAKLQKLILDALRKKQPAQGDQQGKFRRPPEDQSDRRPPHPENERPRPRSDRKPPPDDQRKPADGNRPPPPREDQQQGGR